MNSATAPRTEVPATLRAQLEVFWVHRVVVVVAVVAGVLGAGLLTLAKTPSYTATADVLVRVTSQDPFESGDATKRISMQTEIEVAESERVAQAVTRKLKSAQEATDFADGLRVTNPPETTILRFAYSAEDPTIAAQRANAFADGYLADRRARTLSVVDDQVKVLNGELDDLDGKRAALDTAIRESQNGSSRTALVAQRNLILQESLDLRGRLVTAKTLDATPGDIVRKAPVPSVPDGPGLLMTLALGGLLGLVAGLGLASMVAWLQREAKQDSAARHAGVDLLGTLRRFDAHRVGLPGEVLRSGEASRALALTFVYGEELAKVRTLLLVEPRGVQAARCAGIDLALGLVEMGRSVALVEADLRAPGLVAMLPIVARARVEAWAHGPSAAAAGSVTATAPRPGRWPEVESRDVAASGTGRLRVFPGQIDDRPLEALHAPAAQSFVARLREEYDYVLVVAPGLLTAVDGIELVHLMDGVALVSESRDWVGADLHSAAGYVRRVGVRLVGLVKVAPATRSTV